MPSFYLQTLGALSLRSAGDRSVSPSEDGESEDGEVVGASKGLAVLALLAATPGLQAGRSYLADLLWPDASPSRGRGSLRQALYYVRRRTGAEFTRREGDRLRLRADRIVVDLWELERAAERGRWSEVIRLHRGPFLPEVPGTVSDEFRARVRSVRDRVTARVETAYGRTARDGDRATRREVGAEAPAGGRPLDPPDRHDWVTLIAPATVAAAGLALAALLV